ncbi:MAG: glutamate 5-kinase [Candidatus Hydrogenedentota bacterium]
MKQYSIKSGDRVVIKVGTSLITEGPRPRKKFISELARQISVLRESGIKVSLVSSGAVGTGMGILGIDKRPSVIQEHQAVASIGQAKLMEIYRQLFDTYDIMIAQILLTRDDLSDRRRHLNAKNTIEKLFSWNVLPIINENDTVVVEELKFGDNDNLAALVSLLIDADFLIILTDVDGFYDKDGKIISLVDEITDEMKKIAKNTDTEISRGGMNSKLLACEIAIESGISAIIANGNEKEILIKILNNEKVGTLFKTKDTRVSGRKRWIAYHMKKKGSLVIDDGAAVALKEKGKSLLPSGITEVNGRFERGDAVEIIDKNKNVLGAGIVQYDFAEVNEIKGAQSKDIEKRLGYTFGSEVIHRDDMVISGE